MTDRTKFIGASDIPAVIGISPWVSPLQCYLRKRGELPEQEDKPQLRRGRLLEPYVAQMYAEHTGRQVLPPVFVTGPEPWAAASLDGLSLAPDGGNDRRVLEIKTASERSINDWGEEGSDEIPVYYTAQVQWQLLCARLPRADVAALIGIDTFRVYTVEADDLLQDLLLSRATTFWAAVQSGTPPEPRTEDDMRHLFPHSLTSTVEATDIDLEIVNTLRHIKRQQAELDDQAELLRVRLEHRIGDAEALTMDGKPLVTWKSQERKTVDLKALGAAHPELVEAFRHVTSSRVFRVR